MKLSACVEEPSLRYPVNISALFYFLSLRYCNDMGKKRDSVTLGQAVHLLFHLQYE